MWGTAKGNMASEDLWKRTGIGTSGMVSVYRLWRNESGHRSLTRPPAGTSKKQESLRRHAREFARQKHVFRLMKFLFYYCV